MQEFYRSSGGESITNNNFAALLRQVHCSRAFKPDHAIIGFELAGLFPLNILKVNSEAKELSKIHDDVVVPSTSLAAEVVI